MSAPSSATDRWFARRGLAGLLAWVPSLFVLGLAAWLLSLRADLPSALSMGAIAIIAAGCSAAIWLLMARLHGERQRIEQAARTLERTRDLQAYLAHVNQAAARLDDEQSFVDAVCDLACTHGRLALAVVMCPDAQGQMRFVAAAGQLEYLEDLRISVRDDLPEGRGPSGHAWRSGQAGFNVGFAAAELAPWRARALQLGFEATATLPIRRQASLWALLVLYRGDDMVFEPPMQRLLLDLADNVGHGLDNIDRYQRLRLLDRAVDALSDGLSIADAQRSLTFVNPAFSRITGYAADEVLGRDLRMLQAPATDAQVVARMREALRDGGVFDAEILNLRKDGTPFWNLLHLDTVRDARGRVTHFVVILRDITEQKQALDLQHALLENTTSGILIARERRIVAANTTMSRMLRRDPRELRDADTRILYDSDQEYLRVGVAYQAFLQGRATADCENVRIRRADGVVRLCDLRGRMLADGETAVWTYTDVTQREAQSRALERAQRVYRSLLAVTQSLLQSESDAALLGRLCQQLVQDTDFSSIWIGSPASGEALQTIAFASVDEAARDDLRGRSVALQHTAHPLVQAWATRAAVFSPAATPDTGVALALPVFRAGWPWGVIEFTARSEEVLDRPTRQACEQVAALLGFGFDELDRRAALKRLQDAERQRARTDPLTGLPNRLAFEESLPRAIARADRHQTAVAVGMLDLDDFKPVNDQFGHEAGDRLLQQIGRAFQRGTRSTDLLARIGGDEFVFILEDLRLDRVQLEVQVALQRLQEAADVAIDLGGGRVIRMAMTAGVAIYPSDAEQSNVLLRMADAAMYACKSRKTRRATWWCLAAEADGDAMLPPEARLDAFNDKAQEALQALPAACLDDMARAFSGVFYGELAEDRRHADLLQSLSGAEFEGLQQALAAHLRMLLRPQTTLQQLSARARHVGQVHGLVGLQGASIERSVGVFEDAMRRQLDACPMSSRQRYLIVRVASARLRLDVQTQLEAIDEIASTYAMVLREPVAARLAWVDHLQHVLDGLAALPGIAHALLFRPDEHGILRIEAGAGGQFERLCEVVEREQLHPSLNALPGLPRGPLSNAWFERQVQVVDAYLRDPRLARWRALAHDFGWRSATTIPISKADGTDSLLMLFGRHVYQFSSTWATSWLESLRARMDTIFSLAGRDHRLIEPAQVRNYRELLYGSRLLLWVQPLVDLARGSVCKVEALARLQGAAGEWILPAQFLPAFGEQELHALFRQGLGQALELLRRWQRAGLTMEISVNLPPPTLAHAECANWVRDALARSGIEAQRLTLEILETQDVDPVVFDRAAHALHALGVRLALDDLGAGYSNLTRLASLPLDSVKIDQSLVRDLAGAPLKTMRLLTALTHVGREFSEQWVVEGLESEGHVEAARLLGAPLGQGYALARPMPAEAFESWLRAWRMPASGGPLRTWLGAFTRHWIDTRGLPSAQQAPPDASGALEAFLRERGARQPEVVRWHEVCRSDAGAAVREAAAEDLLAWLAGHCRGELAAQPA